MAVKNRHVLIIMQQRLSSTYKYIYIHCIYIIIILSITEDGLVDQNFVAVLLTS